MPTMSTAPTYAEHLLLDADTVATATDLELAYTIAELLDEQRRRALAGGDLVEIANECFDTRGFDGRGTPRAAYVRDGLLVCPGAKLEKSASSHDCTFVSVDDVWVWEHGEIVLDERRQLPGGQRVIHQTVTILPALEGMEFDVVSSTARSGGPCQMKTARSFKISHGELLETRTRARAPQGHR